MKLNGISNKFACRYEKINKLTAYKRPINKETKAYQKHISKIDVYRYSLFTCASPKQVGTQ